MMLSPDAVLALRLNRRIVAAAVVANETVAFRDSRYFRGPVERAEATVVEFIDRLLADLRPGSVAVSAVNTADADATTQVVFRALERRLAQSGLSVVTIAKPALLSSWGLTALQGWTELRGVVQQLWPELQDVRETVRPYVSDAAALSLHADCRRALNQWSL